MSDSPPVLRRAASLLLVVAACSRAAAEPPPGDPAPAFLDGAASGPQPRSPAETSPSPAPPASAFSREAFALSAGAPGAPGDAGGAELPVPVTADPAVLDEILAAVPGPPVAPSGGEPPRPPPTLGSDTGVVPDAGTGVDHAASRPRTPQLSIGKVTVEPGMSSVSLERAARAQLYWPLVQRCRDAGGAILPPEVIRLQFDIDKDGYVVPATVLALPKEARFADAARCVQRELSIVGFRAPVGARGLVQAVTMDVPSVD